MADAIVPSISVSRDIPASAEAIFAVVANPAMHPFIDGTGMAQRADEVPLTKVGDVFVMHMTHWSLGDYGMENYVVEFVPNRRLVWEPHSHAYESPDFARMPKGPSTRYWGFELEPLGEELTRVTEFFDGSRLSSDLREFLKDGEFWRKGMVESLENLEKLACGRLTPTAPSKEATSGTTRHYYNEVHSTD
jgi:hypothetical protein